MLQFLSEAAGWGQLSEELGEDEQAHEQEVGGKEMMNEVQTRLIQSSCETCRYGTQALQAGGVAGGWNHGAEIGFLGCTPAE